MLPYLENDEMVRYAIDSYDNHSKEPFFKLCLDYSNLWEVFIIDSEGNEIAIGELDSDLFVDAVIEAIRFSDDYLEQEGEVS